MVRIGIIGLGFMGMTHFEGARRLKRGRVTAIASRDPNKLAGDWTSIQGNFGPRGGHVDLSRIQTHADYHDLLADPRVDLVDICLPTPQHEQVVLESLAAGKHTLVEKPIALEVRAADRMIEAARKAGRMLMVAHVLPFFPEFQFAAEAIHGGRYGRLRAAHFRRVISRPDWADLAEAGGPGIDLHIHDNHFIGHACGMPQRLHARGIIEQGCVQHVTTQYLYDDDPQRTVSCTSGGIAAKGLAFGHGFEIYLEQATLLYAFNTLGGEPVLSQPLTVCTATGKLQRPTLRGGTEWCAAFTAELQAVVDGVRQGTVPPLLSATLARNALDMCHRETQSITTGKTVRIIV